MFNRSSDKCFTSHYNMPSYAAAGLLGGVLALGFLIYSIWTHGRPQVEDNRHHSNFGSGNYAHRDSDWGTDDNHQRRRRQRRNKNTCSICLELIEVNERLRALPCHHFFHRECIETWFKERRTCPTCRMPV